MADAACRSGVEILCIGTELLLGNIVNGNARCLPKSWRLWAFRTSGRPWLETIEID